MPNPTPSRQSEDFTRIFALVTREEMGLFVWASKQKHGRTLPAFVVDALWLHARATVKEAAENNNPIPHWVAELLDRR